MRAKRMRYIVATLPKPALGPPAPVVGTTKVVDCESAAYDCDVGEANLALALRERGEFAMKIVGEHLGSMPSDVLSVAVGSVACRAVQAAADGATLTVACRPGSSEIAGDETKTYSGGGAQVDLGMWVRGEVVVTNVKGGQGVSCRDDTAWFVKHQLYRPEGGMADLESADFVEQMLDAVYAYVDARSALGSSTDAAMSAEEAEVPPCSVVNTTAFTSTREDGNMACLLAEGDVGEIMKAFVGNTVVEVQHDVVQAAFGWMVKQAAYGTLGKTGGRKFEKFYEVITKKDNVPSGRRRLSADADENDAAALELALVANSHLKMVRARFLLDALRDGVEEFVADLPRATRARPLSQLCDHGMRLRSFISNFVRHLGSISRVTVGTTLFASAHNLSALVTGASSDDPFVRATMARCWQADALQGSMATGLVQPSEVVQASARRLAASVETLQTACRSSSIPENRQRVVRMARIVEERRMALAAREPLAFLVAGAADRAQIAVRTLTEAIPAQDGVAGLVSPLSGKAMCKVATAMDTMATRAKVGIMQVQKLAPLLTEMLGHAETFQQYAQLINSTFGSSAGLRDAIIEKLDGLIDLILSHDLSPIAIGGKALRAVVDKLFVAAGPIITKIFDFLDTLPNRMRGVASFLQKQLSRLLDLMSIEDALDSLRDVLNSKGACKLLATMKKFAAQARAIIEGGQSRPLEPPSLPCCRESIAAAALLVSPRPLPLLIPAKSSDSRPLQASFPMNWSSRLNCSRALRQ